MSKVTKSSKPLQMIKITSKSYCFILYTISEVVWVETFKVIFDNVLQNYRFFEIEEPI